jgi:proline dehydrogenase
VQAEHIAPERFDFEMLFGVRRDLQLGLVSQGYRVRVYLPYGQEWYPYLVRRLAERPANLGFFVRSLLAEALAGRRDGRPSSH